MLLKQKLALKVFLIFIFSNKAFTIAFYIQKCIQLIYLKIKYNPSFDC